jgi:hypothetical protein
MAAPFGGHPRLIDYLGWCSQQGCTTTSGFNVKDGVTVTFHIVAAASGEYVVISGIGNNEYLVPTVVAYLDRRLGLDSPFAKVGDGRELPDAGG